MSTIKSKSGRVFKLDTVEEEAEIRSGIAADPDAGEVDGAWFTKARLGRPPSASPKVYTGIRLDPDVLEAFKAEGAGWQTRINAALREWLSQHRG